MNCLDRVIADGKQLHVLQLLWPGSPRNPGDRRQDLHDEQDDKARKRRERFHPANPVHPVRLLDVNEIITKFGDADQLRTAINQLQSLLYAA